MLRKLPVLFVFASELTFGGPLTIAQSDDPRSGVVVFDPKIHSAPKGSGELLEPNQVMTIRNVNATNTPGAQNETSIDMNPLNNREIVGGVNDYRAAANNDVNCGYVHSNDGGASWSSGFLSGITFGNGGPFNFQAAGDPSVYYGVNGTVYYACLGFERDHTRSAILLSKSSDGGATWSTPVPIVESNTASAFHDKEMITVDNGPSSPFLGRLYVAWTLFEAGARILLSYSPDDGATWSTPAVVSGQQSTVHGAHPAVGPDGTVYTSWCSPCTGSSATIWINTSFDGGINWGSPVPATAFTGLPSPLPGNSFRVNSFPTVAVNPVSNDVYLAFADYTNGDADILFVRSTNHGATWSTPIRVNNNTTDDQFFQWMDVSPAGVIWVCYYDQSWNTTNWLDTSCSVSLNGFFFGRSIRMTSESSDPANDGFGGAFIGDYNGVAVGRSNIPQMLWTDIRSGNAEAFTRNPELLEPRDFVVP